MVKEVASSHEHVLILGATGLLGTYLLKALRSKGLKILGLGHRGDTDISCDATDSKRLLSVLSEVQPSIIINLIALTDVDKCDRDPHLAYKLNMHPCSLLASWTQDDKNSNTRIVHISTDHIYDETKGLAKEHQITIRNTYGLSKLAGDLIFDGLNVAVLRTNFFGRSLKTGRKSFSDWVIESSLHQTPVTVFDDVLFSPLSFTSISNAIYHVINNFKPGVFNLGSHGGMSKSDFAFNLCEVLRLQTEHMTRGRMPDTATTRRPRNMTMNCSHFENTFNYGLTSLTDELSLMKEEYAHGI